MKPAELLADSKFAETRWTLHSLFDVLKNMQGNHVKLRIWITNEHISIKKHCVETIFNAFLRNNTFLITLSKTGTLPNTGTVTLLYHHQIDYSISHRMWCLICYACLTNNEQNRYCLQVFRLYFICIHKFTTNDQLGRKKATYISSLFETNWVSKQLDWYYSCFQCYSWISGHLLPPPYQRYVINGWHLK